MRVKYFWGFSAVTIGLAAFIPGSANAILFDFDNATLDSALPISLTVDGLTANLSSTNKTDPSAGFAVWNANTYGFTPAGFSGLSLYPTAVFSADLNVNFSQPLTNFSILYANVEYGSDTSPLMRVTADMNGTPVGTSTAQADGGTWPTATLSFSSALEFNHVVVQLASILPGTENWAPVFAADNMDVTLAPSAVPLPAALPLFATGLGALGLLGWRRKRKALAA